MLLVVLVRAFVCVWGGQLVMHGGGDDGDVWFIVEIMCGRMAVLVIVEMVVIVDMI